MSPEIECENGGGGGGGGGGGVIDFVELLQMTPRYQTTNWLSVSQESVKHVMFYCWLSIF